MVNEVKRHPRAQDFIFYKLLFDTQEPGENGQEKDNEERVIIC